MADWLISILMIAGFALFAGGIYILLKGTNKRQGILMLIAAAVMFGNVIIWLAPVPENTDPVAAH